MRDRLIAGLVVALCAAGLAACGGGERQDEDEPEGEFPVEIVSAEFAPRQRLAQTNELTLSVRNAGDETIPDLAVTIFTEAQEDLAAEDAADDSPDPEAGTAEDLEGEEIPEEELGAEVDKALEEELEEAESGSAGDDADPGADEDAGGEQDSTVEEQDAGEETGGADGAFSVLSPQEGLAVPSRPVWILEQGYPVLAGEEPTRGPPGELAGGSGADAAQTNTFAFGELEPDETVSMVWQVTPVVAGNYTVRYRIAAGLQGKAVAVNDDGSTPAGEFVVVITDVPPQTRVNDAGEVVPIKPGDIIGQAGSEEQRDELGSGSGTETTP